MSAVEPRYALDNSLFPAVALPNSEPLLTPAREGRRRIAGCLGVALVFPVVMLVVLVTYSMAVDAWLRNTNTVHVERAGSSTMLLPTMAGRYELDLYPESGECESAVWDAPSFFARFQPSTSVRVTPSRGTPGHIRRHEALEGAPCPLLVGEIGLTARSRYDLELRLDAPAALALRPIDRTGYRARTDEDLKALGIVALPALLGLALLVFARRA